MRIQAQCETFALRIAATSDFPWRIHPGDDGSQKLWTAPLENGHSLEVTGFGPKGINSKFWAAHYRDGIQDPAADYLKDWHAAPNPNHYPKEDQHFWPSREHAMQAAEQAYQQKYPIGTNTGPHDSGVDYSDLNSFKDYL